MGLLDFFARRKALTATPEVVASLRGGNSIYPRLGGTNVQRINDVWQQAQTASYGYMYRTQPAVRKVVHKIADNLSQMCPKLYERVSDTERQTANDHPAAETLRYPNSTSPADQFIYDVIADWLIYDNAYVVMFPTSVDLPTTLIRWPVQLVVVLGTGIQTTGYRLYLPDGSSQDYPPERILHWRGYNPDDPRMGVAPLETLRQILAEDAASGAASEELSKSGLRGGHIERPLDAPEWSPEGMQRFIEGWANQAKASPRRTPVLDEGMTFKNDAISPKDAQLLEGRQFTTDEVADVYGVPRGMFSDEIKEDDRDAFYADVIAPMSKKLASVLDHNIVLGIYGETTDNYFFEFDLNEKLRGSPEKRWPAMTSAAGRAWQTVNEVREAEGKPPIEGGDELAIQANVMLIDENGNPINPNPNTPQLPAPNVMPPQDPNKPPQDGSYREQPKALTNGKALELSTRPRRQTDMARQRRYIDEAQGVLERFYSRQLRSIKSKSKFDSERWNRELADELNTLISSIMEREGGIYVARLAGEDFDLRQRINYIQAMSAGMAERMNAVTQKDFEGEMTAREALERANSERAAIAARGIGTRATLIARQEAASQAPGTEHRMQTWIADTDRHSQLDGVSVPLGSDWGGIEPGSEPGCACSAVIT